jgi:hypothetical protein
VGHEETAILGERNGLNTHKSFLVGVRQCGWLLPFLPLSQQFLTCGPRTPGDPRRLLKKVRNCCALSAHDIYVLKLHNAQT